jgi:hypothetical protein
MFVKTHGTPIIPLSFKIPNNSAVWPERLKGMKLGKEAGILRQRNADLELPPGDVDILDQVGFAWRWNEWTWQHRAALLAYKEVHGDMNVPKKFIIPSKKPWPEVVWNFKLGDTVDTIRSTGGYVEDYPKRRRWLEFRGFVFDDKERLF